MTIQCRNVLKELRHLSSNIEDEFALVDDANYICLDCDDSIRYDYTKYKNEIKGIIKQLVLDGYLNYDSNSNVNYFTLTHKGLHPYQFQWAIFKSFLIKSILVPAVVSFVTTLCTLILQWLLTLQ